MSMGNQKLNILIVHNYYQIPGGEDTVIANEIKMLEAHGYKVVLYSRNNSELKQMSVFRKLLLPLTTIFNPRTYQEVKKIIREQSIDVVHVHNTLSLVSPSVYYAALACKTPVVQTIHNFRLLCPGATFYRDGHICEDCTHYGLKCAVKHSCYRNSKVQTMICAISTQIHRMSGIYGKLNYICLTEFNRKKLLQLEQIPPENVFVKPNFICESDEIIPYNKRKEQFIFAGRLDKLKGIDLLLVAWKLMGSDAPNLVICGAGPMEDWCKQYILENELTSVEMKGFLSNEQTRQVIAESKALILPTQWYEGFPMTIAEAYSLGTPVLGSDIGNVGDLIKDGVTGFIFQHDSPQKIVEMVNKCSSRNKGVPEEYRKLYTQENNYEILSQIYSVTMNRVLS